MKFLRPYSVARMRGRLDEPAIRDRRGTSQDAEEERLEISGAEEPAQAFFDGF
jgi:hypothetical protein